MNGRAKSHVIEELINDRQKNRIAGRALRTSQFALPITRASADRTYPGGLPRFDRTSSQSPTELTTLIRVPRLICEITRAAGAGFSYTEVSRVVS